MVQKRSKDEIVAKILSICQGDGLIKTQVVYQANLNFRTITPPLDLLLRKGLLEVTQGDRPIYKTTPKGAQALETLQKAQEICS
jgi:predicted transcriptional regulator